MILNADAKALEWICINWFSQDNVGREEILAQVDQHTVNAERFGLPDRRIALSEGSSTGILANLP